MKPHAYSTLPCAFFYKHCNSRQYMHGHTAVLSIFEEHISRWLQSRKFLYPTENRPDFIAPLKKELIEAKVQVIVVVDNVDTDRYCKSCNQQL